MKKQVFSGLLTLVALVLGTTGLMAQSTAMTTKTVNVYGNCGMCEKTIEKAAFVEGVAEADWDKKTKQAVIRYDSTKTNVDEVLQRIADSGYDNESYRAPDKAYGKLPKCCKYERKPE